MRSSRLIEVNLRRDMGVCDKEGVLDRADAYEVNGLEFTDSSTG